MEDKILEQWLKDAKPIEVKLDLSGATIGDLSKAVFVIAFNDSPGGKLAWHILTKMEATQKAKMNVDHIDITRPITLMPGMGLGVILPNGKCHTVFTTSEIHHHNTYNINVVDASSFAAFLESHPDEAFKILYDGDMNNRRT